VKRKRENLPPGPRPLPIVGNLLALNPQNPIETFFNWHIKYGDIYKLQFGSHPVIVINSPELWKEAFVSQANVFNGRYSVISMEHITFGFKEVGFSSGDYWKNIRKVFISSLQSGSQMARLPVVVEENMKKYIYSILEPAAEKNLEVDNITKLIRHTFMCTISRIGVNIDFNEKIEILAEEMIAFAGSVNIVDYLPWLMYTPLGPSFVKKLKDFQRRSRELYIPIIEDHKKNLNPNDPKDVYDFLLVNQKANGWEEETFLGVAIDLFNAGVDTSADTVGWAIAQILRHQKVQQKIHEEMDKVVGRNRKITVDDIPNLPYFNAFLQENMRVIPVGPLALPHCTLSDTTLGGYRIPKDTMIIPNVYALQNSPKYWDDAKEFKPERFLEIDSADVRFSPFGLGPHQCPGMRLAKLSTAQIVASIVQKYDLLPPHGQTNFELPKMKIGLTIAPMPYKFTVKKRF